MSKRVTPAEIQEMYRLYEETPSYAEVARKMGRSKSTVSRYLKLKGAPKNVPHAMRQAVIK